MGPAHRWRRGAAPPARHLTMKLVTFEHHGATCAGVLVDGAVYPADALLRTTARIPDVRALLELAPDILERLRHALRGSLPLARPLEALQLRAPVLQPPALRAFSGAAEGREPQLHVVHAP